MAASSNAMQTNATRTTLAIKKSELVVKNTYSVTWRRHLNNKCVQGTMANEQIEVSHACLAITKNGDKEFLSNLSVTSSADKCAICVQKQSNMPDHKQTNYPPSTSIASTCSRALVTRCAHCEHKACAAMVLAYMSCVVG